MVFCTVTPGMRRADAGPAAAADGDAGADDAAADGELGVAAGDVDPVVAVGSSSGSAEHPLSTTAPATRQAVTAILLLVVRILPKLPSLEVGSDLSSPQNNPSLWITRFGAMAGSIIAGMITGMTVKLTISLPDDLAAEVRAAVRDGRAPSVSAYVAQAIEWVRDRPTLEQVLNEMDEEFGPSTPEELAWAKEQMTLTTPAARRVGSGE
jgi:Arc/MetJ-type ribon-helix-helix transcriptional regulator